MPSQNKILLSTHEFYHLIDINQIIYCESNNSYTSFYLTGNQKLTVSTPIKEIEKKLPENYFVRPHQSFLVNVLFISALRKINTCELILKNETCIPVSSRKKTKVLQFLEKSSHIQD